MADRVIVRFQLPYGKFAAGELAGFSPERAERLCGARGVLRTTADGVTSERVVAVAVRVSDDELARITKRAEAAAVPTPAPALVAVRFRQEHGKYNAGDVAGFDAITAKALTTPRRSPAGTRPPIADLLETGPQIPRDLDAASYQDLKSIAAALGLDATGKKKDLVERLEAHRRGEG